jgi:hypothetical protein
MQFNINFFFLLNVDNLCSSIYFKNRVYEGEREGTLFCGLIPFLSTFMHEGLFSQMVQCARTSTDSKNS